MNIDFPFHFDASGRTATADDDAHIREMIEQLVFAPNSPEIAAALQFTLRGAIQRWLGDLIELQDLQVTSVDSTLTIDLQYLRRQTGRTQTAQITRTV
jgi:hypothetical protein